VARSDLVREPSRDPADLGASGLGDVAASRGRKPSLWSWATRMACSAPTENQALILQTRVLYTSGDPDDVDARHAALGLDNSFLEKPFSGNNLIVKIREILDSPKHLAALHKRRDGFPGSKFPSTISSL
jgi:hypothetical protein